MHGEFTGIAAGLRAGKRTFINRQGKHVKSKKDILDSLAAVEGFKAIMKGSFIMRLLLKIFKKDDINNSFQIFTSAAKKGVYDNIILRTEIYNNCKYWIYAFSLKNDIPSETVKMLEEKSAAFDIKSIKRESSGFLTLQKYVDTKEGESFDLENNPVAALAQGLSGIAVFAMSSANMNDEFPYTLYASKDGYAYIYPIEEKLIQ